MKTWDDFLAERMRREDEYIRRKFSRYAYLGRGHLNYIGDINE
jgi:hypothetical protein